MTITEALAEIKTIDKRLAKKRESVSQYLFRQGAYTDPLAPDGGSRKFVAGEQQGIKDLEERKVAIRRAVAKANESTQLTINGVTRSIAGWLTWRKEVAPGRQAHVGELRKKLEQLRRDAMAKGLQVTNTDSVSANEVIVNLSERDLAKEAEALEETLGSLDGLLSLKNATITLEV